MTRRARLVLSILSGYYLLVLVQKNFLLAWPPSNDIAVALPKQSCHNQTVALCLVQKGDMRYVDEWVDYHLALGFDTIYMMDNTEDFELQPWHQGRRDEYRIRVTHVPGNRIQNHAYRLCADQVERDNHTWVSFLDVDEFFVLKQHDSILNFACEYVQHGHVGVNWMVFGTSGHVTVDERPVTQKFQCRYEGSDENDYIKSILRVEDLGSEPIYDPHIFPRRKGTELTHTNGVVFDQSRHQGPYDVAAIYHFFYKSKEEFIHKRRRGNAFFGPNVHLDAALAGIDSYGRQLPHGTMKDDLAWKKP